MTHSRDILAFAFLAIWAFMIWQNPHEPLIVGAMIATISSVAGFYYGAAKTQSKTPADQAQPVEVVNTAAAPVIVEKAGE